MGGAYLLFGILLGMVIGAIAVFIYDAFVIREINKIHETHYKEYKAQAEKQMERLYASIARYEAQAQAQRQAQGFHKRHVDVITREINCAKCPKEACPLWDPAKGCPLGKEPEGKDDGKDFHWYDD